MSVYPDLKVILYSVYSVPKQVLSNKHGPGSKDIVELEECITLLSPPPKQKV
jgi:hypothetical protein